MEVRLKPLLKGAASFVVPSLRTVHGKLDKMSAADAEFCYSLFLRHYSYVAPYFENGIPKVVAELGPGSSLGMGLCALLLGADTYYALDIVDHTDPVREPARLGRTGEDDQRASTCSWARDHIPGTSTLGFSFPIRDAEPRKAECHPR